MSMFLCSKMCPDDKKQMMNNKSSLYCEEVLDDEEWATPVLAPKDDETSFVYMHEFDLDEDAVPLADLFLTASDATAKSCEETDQLVSGALLGLCALKHDSPPSTPKMVSVANATPTKSVERCRGLHTPVVRHSDRKRSPTYVSIESMSIF